MLFYMFSLFVLLAFDLFLSKKCATDRKFGYNEKVHNRIGCLSVPPNSMNFSLIWWNDILKYRYLFQFQQWDQFHRTFREFEFIRSFSLQLESYRLYQTTANHNILRNSFKLMMKQMIMVHWEEHSEHDHCMRHTHPLPSQHIHHMNQIPPMKLQSCWGKASALPVSPLNQLGSRSCLTFWTPTSTLTIPSITKKIYFRLISSIPKRSAKNELLESVLNSVIFMITF